MVSKIKRLAIQTCKRRLFWKGPLNRAARPNNEKIVTMLAMKKGLSKIMGCFRVK